MTEQKSVFYPLGGGLDLVTQPITIPPGRAIAALNYEATASGYRRISGYERYDGRPAPSDATWLQLSFTAGVVANMVPGATVTGLTSGATGVALTNAVVTSGTYGAGNAVGYVGLGAVTGAFVNGEALRVGGVTQATSSGTGDLEGSPDDATALIWRTQARTNARALISAVPGSGPVRGVWEYNGNRYAFRDNVAATAGIMYQATTAGWVPVVLSRSLVFTSGGTYVPLVGNTLTGATSGATAVIARVVLTSGTWAAGTAAGYFITNTQVGNFIGEDLNVGATLNVATVAGNSNVQTINPGGRYEFINYNFYGASSQLFMYGVNGKGKAFQFDGATFTFITTGMPVDAPTRLAAHKYHLFLSFLGGSLQLSATGDPLSWSAILGAAEIAVGDDIVDLVPANPSVLTIFAKNSISNLYGTGVADFQLEVLTNESGALPYTADKVGSTIYMDNRGIRSIATTQAYGNFNIGSLTQAVKPMLDANLKAGLFPTAAMRVRARDTYRVFFGDGTGLNVYMGKGKPEIMPFELPITIRCTASIEDSLQQEHIYAGSHDGFVYELDRGDSFDGAAIEYFLRLPFTHLGAPQIRKRWHRIVVEVIAGGSATLRVSPDFDYADPEEPSQPPTDLPLFGIGGAWDLSLWDTFYWSSAIEGQATAYLDGIGQNMSLLFAGTSIDEATHTLTGINFFYSPRGQRQ